MTLSSTEITNMNWGCRWRMTFVFLMTLVVILAIPPPCDGFGISPTNMRKEVSVSSKLWSTPDNKMNSRRRTTTASSTGSSNSRTQNRFKGSSGRASSSSSPSSPSSSKSRSQTWYKNRSSKGIKSKNRKRTPRWETEGDALYQLIDVSSKSSATKLPTTFRTKQEEYQYIEQLLSTSMTTQTQPDDGTESQKEQQTPLGSTSAAAAAAAVKGTKKEEQQPKNEDSSPSFKNMMMWGTCSVGPLLRTKLVDTWGPTPTPIQQMSFPLLSSSNQNIILASPTGTGKTLAYLLPLLSTMSRTTTTIKKKKNTKNNPNNPILNNISCKVMIVTPTIDLAHQIQQQVNWLWPPLPDESSSMYVVEQQQQQKQLSNKDNHEENDNDNHEDNTSFDTTRLQHASIVAGTPRALSQMMMELKKQPKSRGMNLYTQLRMNLRSIVLDEADRLLRTESVARAAAATTATTFNKKFPRHKSSTIKHKKSPTEMLLSQFPRLNYHYIYTNNNNCESAPLSQTKKKKKKKTAPRNADSSSNIQLVCASATVGRTLRRQIMEMIDAPSIDKAATLVTADPKRTKKGTASTRKSTLLPSTIQHMYVLPPPTVVTDTHTNNDDDDRTPASSATSTATTTTAAADALVQTLHQQQLKPAPLLVFPGNMGVSGMVETLQTKHGFQNVQTLPTLQHPSKEEEDHTSSTIPITPHYSNWSHTPVYVIGEKFGRGLDLQVDYVWLSSTPSSPAAYTHLAGRTGRNQKKGHAMTFVQSMKDAQKVMQMSDMLGIQFTNIRGLEGSPPTSVDDSVQEEDGITATVVGGGDNDDDEDNDYESLTTTTSTALSPPSIDREDKEDRSTNNTNDAPNNNPWSSLSKSALGRKTVAELRHYLEERNVDTTDKNTSGKKLRKADFIAMVEELG